MLAEDIGGQRFFGKTGAESVAQAMLTAFKQHQVNADHWISPINPNGAYTL